MNLQDIQKETIDKETGEVTSTETKQDEKAEQKQEQTQVKAESDNSESERKKSNEFFLEEIESLGNDSLYWSKQFPLEKVDVIAMNVGYQWFEGVIQTDSKGNKKFKFELVVKNESGQMTIVGGSTTSKLKDVLGTANKLYDMNSTHLYDIVGKKINLKCTNYEAVKDDDAKAYTYRAEVIGEADHKTEGIWNLETGERIK